MELITIFFLCASIGGLILQYWRNEPPFCLLSEIFSVGGLVTVLNDFGNNAIEEAPALVLVIAMIGVMVWSAWNMVNAFMPNKKRR